MGLLKQNTGIKYSSYIVRGHFQLNMKVRVAGRNLSNKEKVSERRQEDRAIQSPFISALHSLQ